MVEFLHLHFEVSKRVASKIRDTGWKSSELNMVLVMYSMVTIVNDTVLYI